MKVLTGVNECSPEIILSHYSRTLQCEIDTSIVQCVAVSTAKNQLYCPTWFTLDPIQAATCILYTVEPQWNSVRILGTVYWHHVFSTKGLIELRHVRKTFDFKPLWDISENKFLEPSFKIDLPPCLLSFEPNLFADVSDLDLKLSAIVHSWLMKSENLLALDSKLWIILEILSILSPLWFHDVWQNYAHKWVQTQLQPIEEAGEKAMAQFLHGLNATVENHVVDGTLIDRQIFATKYPNERPPTIWYAIPMEEMPLERKYVYDGGLVHICHRDVANWLWERVLLYHRQLSTRLLVNSNVLDWRLNLLLQPLLQKIQKFNHRGQNRKNSKSQCVTLGDIEDLASCSPPCLRPLVNLNRGKFLKDGQRQYVVRILQRGKLSLESTRDFFERLHTRYPEGHGGSAKQRWNYEICYEKGYGGVNCENLPSCMQCPWADEPLHVRKQKCHETLHTEHPTSFHPNQASYFYGPSSWLRWALQGTIQNEN